MQTPNVRRITMGEGREGEGRNCPQKKKEKKREGKYNNLRHENKNE